MSPFVTVAMIIALLFGVSFMAGLLFSAIVSGILGMWKESFVLGVEAVMIGVILWQMVEWADGEGV